MRLKAETHGYAHIAQKAYAHLLNRVAGPVTRHLLRAEYHAQRADPLGPNERPVEYSSALEALALSSEQDVLDVGPGTSPWPALLATCGYHVTAIDEMLQYWGGRLVNRHFHVIHDNILSPKLKSKFGIITCISTLEHIPHHRAAIIGMAGLLREAGILVLSFPYNENRYIPDAYALPEANGYGAHANYVCQVYDRETVHSWCESAALSVESQRYFQVFRGKYWACGARLRPAREVRVSEPHHLTVLALRKANPPRS
ncbi:MAG TPA: class I SAM-dependent methyltransferase [Terriglobales bacterium]